jgi:hypothetical protein
MKPEQITDILRLVALLVELATDVAKAIATGDVTRVEAVLPQTLETSLAKLRADLEAVKKFGPRP